MKILYLALVELEVYNAPRTHTIEVCENLTKLGHEMLLLIPKPRKKIQNFPFKILYVPFFGWGPMREFIFHILLSVYIFLSILKFKPDAVYERMLGNPLCLKITKFFRIKHVLEINGPPYQNAHGRKIKRIRNELMRTDKIIVPSPKLKNHIQSLEKFNDNKIQFIPNGVNPHFFFPRDKMQARQELGIPQENFYIVYTGGIYYAYDFDFVVKALNALGKEATDIRLLAIGATYKSNYENILFEKNVKYEDIPLYISAADLCLLPLSKNGLETQDFIARVKLFEYVGCGKIVLIPKLQDEKIEIPEPLRKFLVFYKHGDEQDFIEKVKEFYYNRNLLERRNEDVDAFTKEYSWETTARKIVEFIKGL